MSRRTCGRKTNRGGTRFGGHHFFGLTSASTNSSKVNTIRATQLRVVAAVKEMIASLEEQVAIPNQSAGAN